MATRKATKKGRKEKSRIALIAKSEQTGINHTFDVRGIESLVANYIAQNIANLKSNLINSSNFWNWLQRKSKINSAPVTWTNPIYRIVYGGYNALSVAGSLAAGGRFNVGAAQDIGNKDLFPSLQTQACLYGASTIICARIEVGASLGPAEEYEILSNSALSLWDISDVISQLDYPSLKSAVDCIPMSAAWKTQKCPLVPQLLASHLRHLGRDGVVCPSTKDPSAMNVALFVKDDVESAAKFSAKRIN